MRLCRRQVIALLATLGLAPAGAAEVLRVCVVEHEFAAPGSFKQEGPAQYLVRKAGADQGRVIQFVGAPWQRCLSGSKAGQYDGVIGASASPAFAEFLRLPMKGDQPDASAAIGHSRHQVVKLAGSAAQWNGKQFAGLKGAVYYPTGSAIVRDKLATLGVAGNDQSKTAQQLLRMLLRQRIDIVVARQDDLELLVKDTEFAGKLEVLPEPFVTAYAYFAVRRALYDSDAARIEKIWADISRRRAAPDWAKTERELGAKVASAKR